MPRIMPCGPDQIVQAKARKQNAAAPAAANVLKDEGQPHDRHVPDVEHGRPRDHGALIDPLHLSGGKMVIGDRLRIRREVRGTGVDTRRSRVDRQVAADVPRHPTLLKIGERVVHDAPSHARVVVHRIPDEHSALVEELGVAHGIQPAARLVVANRVGLDLRSLALDERLPAQEDGLAVALHDERLGHVTGDAVTRQLEQRVDHVIGSGKGAARSGRQAEPARGCRVDAAVSCPCAVACELPSRCCAGVLDRASDPRRRRRARGGRCRRRILSSQCARPEQQQHDGRRRHATRAPAARDPGAPDAELIEQQQRNEHQQHRDGIRGGEDRRQPGSDGDRVAPLPSQEFRRDDPERCENRDHERQFRDEPASHHERHRHPEIAIDRDHRVQIVALKPEQHPKSSRQQPLITRDRADEKQKDTDDEGRHDESLFTLVQCRREKCPDLIDDDRRRHQAAQRERHFHRQHERLGGAREDESPARQVGSDGTFQPLDDVDAVEQEPANDRADDDGKQTPQDAPAQLLEMIEKRHLTARRTWSRRGRYSVSHLPLGCYGLRRC